MSDKAVVTFNGSFDTRVHDPSSQYDLISFEQIVERAEYPTAVDKERAPAIIPSSYHAFNARSHHVQREQGEFQFLSVDIDSGSPSLEAIKGALVDFGNPRAVIYSTASATPKNLKWRIIIPLRTPISGSEYRFTAEAFFSLLQNRGIECDFAMAREAQPVFLPNVPPECRQGGLATGLPLFYEFTVLDGNPLDLSHPLLTARVQQERELRGAETADLKGRFSFSSQSRRGEWADFVEGNSIIAQFNAANPIELLFERYGYRYGGRDNWRSPYQQGKSFATKCFGDAWYSLSTSDVAIGRQAKDGGRFGDAFDLTVHFEFGGDFKAAIRAVSKDFSNRNRAILLAQSTVGPLDGLGGTPDVFDEIASDLQLEEIEMSGDEPDEPSFEEALASLKNDPKDRAVLDVALKHYAAMAPLEKAIAEGQLRQATGLALGVIRATGRDIAKAENAQDELTHSEIADDFLSFFKRRKDMPIGSMGHLFLYDSASGIWRKRELSWLKVLIGRRYREQKNAKRETDYNGISKMIYASVEDKEFFSSSNRGICSKEGFWHVVGSEIACVPHSKQNKSRFGLEMEPDFSAPPTLFEAVLREAFKQAWSPNSGVFFEQWEHEQEILVDAQLRLMRQLFGATLLGILPKEQIAVFLYGAAGSFKSGTLRILQSMFAPDAVTVVSPAELDQDYKKAVLANKLLNVVPEIDPDKPIPAAEFKAVLGEDLLSARLPYGVPFQFKSEASNWFNGNAFPMTRDHGEAFFRRWVIVHFKTTKAAEQRDPQLVKRIIDTELAKIVGWAIEGARDLLVNGLALTDDHHRQLSIWKLEGNPVACWLGDDAGDSGIRLREIGDEGLMPILRSEAYRRFKIWTQNSGRPLLNKSRWKSELSRLGYNDVKRTGDFVFPEIAAIANWRYSIKP